MDTNSGRRLKIAKKMGDFCVYLGSLFYGATNEVVVLSCSLFNLYVKSAMVMTKI